MLIVFTTTSTLDEAELLSERVIAARLAACVQIVPQITSIYVWEDKVQKEGEHLMLIKTLTEKWEELRDFITANHSYDVPEIVAIDAVNVSGPYFEWIKNTLS